MVLRYIWQFCYNCNRWWWWVGVESGRYGVCVFMCRVGVLYVAFFTIQPLMLRAWLNSHLRMFCFFELGKMWQYVDMSDLCWALVEQSKFVCQNQLSRSSVCLCVCWCFNISICCISGNVVKKVVVCFKISESLSRAKTIYTSKKVVKFLLFFVLSGRVCVTKKLGWKFFTFFWLVILNFFCQWVFFNQKHSITTVGPA